MHLVNQSSLLTALGWALLDSLWQMSLMWLLYILVTIAFGKKMSSGYRHFISLFFISTGVCWFAFSLGNGLLSPDFSRPALTAYHLPGTGNLSFFAWLKKDASLLLPYGSAVYLAVVVLLMARYYRYYVISQKMKETGLHKVPPTLRLFVQELAGRMGIGKGVQLWFSSNIQTPMTIGFLKPFILIPLATINHLTTEQMEAVLLHELAHIKRHDYLLNLFITGTEIIFFFNPFARLLVYAIKKERENSCDDWVMQFRYDVHAYATALLSLERARHQSERLAMAAIGKSNKMLLDRVMRITGQKIALRGNIHRFASLLLLSVVVTCFALIDSPRPASAQVAEARQGRATVHMTELLHSSYRSSAAVSASDLETPDPPRYKRAEKAKRKTIVVEPDEPETPLEGDDLSESDQEATEVSAELPRAYSMTEDPSAAAAISPGSRDYPYVPSSSFAYDQAMEDSFAARQNTFAETADKAAIQTITKALKDLQNMKSDKKLMPVEVEGEKVNFIKLENNLQNCLSLLDCNKIKLEITGNLMLSEMNNKRMRSDLKVQLQALQEIKVKDFQKAQRLQQDISKQKIRILQTDLQKQNELRLQLEELRRKMKIVYI